MPESYISLRDSSSLVLCRELSTLRNAKPTFGRLPKNPIKGFVASAQEASRFCVLVLAS